MLRRHVLTAALALAACPAVAFAQDAGAEPEPAPEVRGLEDLLEPVLKRHGVPALGAALVVGPRMTAVGAVGLRRAGQPEQVTRDDLWHIGSCTKAMTATLVAQLVEAGKLTWDQPLGKTFPKLAKRMHADWRPVPLELLLANRSGAPNDLSAGGLWGRLWERRGSLRAQHMQLVEGVLTAAPAAAPGTTYLYSNAGFSIAGTAAEEATDTEFQALMQRELFAPLEMRSAAFGPPGTPGKADQPRGHRAAGLTFHPVEPGPQADNPPAISAAGRVHLTLHDWAKFVALHVRGAAAARDPEAAAKEPKLLLEPATFTKLHTPLKGQTYALGWNAAERKWAGGRTLSHTGSNTMWFAVVWIAPEKDFAVLATCNAAGDLAAKACDQAVWAVIQQHLGR